MESRIEREGEESESTGTIERVLSAALSLPRADRERIAETLVASLDHDPELDDRWDLEIDRRIREAESGSATMIPAEEVLKAGDDLLREGTPSEQGG